MGTESTEPFEDLMDIKGPVAIPTYEWVWWTVAGVLLCSLLIWLWLRARNKKAAYVAPPPTPFEVAMKRLNELMGNSDTLSDKEFIVEVSDVLRTFIEAKIHIPAPELTTEEFLEKAANHKLLKGEKAEKLSGFLQICDLVKFAKQSLAKEHRVELHESALTFIKTVQ